MGPRTTLDRIWTSIIRANENTFVCAFNPFLMRCMDRSFHIGTVEVWFREGSRDPPSRVVQNRTIVCDMVYIDWRPKLAVDIDVFLMELTAGVIVVNCVVRVQFTGAIQWVVFC